MANRVDCQNCGAGITLPSGYARAKIRCAGCGHYVEVPPELRGLEGEEEVAPPAPAVAAARPVRAEPVAAKRAAPIAPAPAAPRPRRIDDDDDADSEGQYGFAEPLPPPPSMPLVKPSSGAVKKSREAKPQVDPRDFRPRFEPDDPDNPGGEPLLRGTQEESDDETLPYTVPGTGLRPCPECRGQLPLDATLCVHCGTDLATGQKAGRTFQPIHAEWHEGWKPVLRLQIFVALQIVNFLAAVVLLATGGLSFDAGGIFSFLVTQGFQIALQSFLIGSYDTLTVKRNAKGSATMTRTRRICFFKLPVEKLPWKNSSMVGITGTDVGLFPRLLCLYFLVNSFLYCLSALLSLFMIGLALIYLAVGIGFYWIVLRPTRCQVNLCDIYGSTDEVAFRSDSREQAEEVCEIISEATGLKYRKVM